MLDRMKWLEAQVQARLIQRLEDAWNMPRIVGHVYCRPMNWDQLREMHADGGGAVMGQGVVPGGAGCQAIHRFQVGQQDGAGAGGRRAQWVEVHVLVPVAMKKTADIRWRSRIGKATSWLSR